MRLLAVLGLYSLVENELHCRTAEPNAGKNNFDDFYVI